MSDDLPIGLDGKFTMTDDEFPWELDENGNLVRKDRIKPGDFGNNLYKLIDHQIDKQVVEDILQHTIDYYWEENCEGEIPPNIEVVEATHDNITFLVQEDDPWSFTVPI